MKRFRRWIRSLFGWLKPWHKPFVRRWPVYEGGEMVESNGKMYVILHPSLRVAGRGPTCYLALNAFGVMESINNWETRRAQ